MNKKYISKSQLQELITKYNLQQKTTDCFNCPLDYNCYSATTNINNVKTIYTLENQMSHDLDNGSIYFLTIEIYDHNKLKYNKKLDVFTATTTLTTQMLIVIDE